VRAILRSADRDTEGFGLGNAHLSNIDGFKAYRNGKADYILGLVTPDPLTLSIRLARPDDSIPYVMALPITAPIPPSPSDPSAPYGVATGHDVIGDPSKVRARGLFPIQGYGLFQVSSGPYMIEGEETVDFSLPPADQIPPSGFKPWKYADWFDPIRYGSLTLVRNPSWDPTTDPIRLALPDRIVIQGGSSVTLFREFRSGRLDMVFDGAPPPRMLDRYLNAPTLRPYVESLPTGNIVIAEFNLTQPPFDDLAVRRAVAFGLDRRAMLNPIRRGYGGNSGWSAAVVANHYAPDSSEDGLPSGWSPFSRADGAPDRRAAHSAMKAARYRIREGRCVDPVCRHVKVFLHGNIPQVAERIRRDLATLGISAVVTVPDDFYAGCQDPHVGLCVGSGWLPDYPFPRDLLISMFAGTSLLGGIGLGNTRLGASEAELAERGATVRSVPSVDPMIKACDELVGAAAVACWTRLDQYVIAELMPTVPLAFGEVIRLTSPSIVSFAWDQGAQSPALERLAVVNERADAPAPASQSG
jgi:ABC-type transport system substrate-binding protein